MVPVMIDPTSPDFKKYLKYALYAVIAILLVLNMYMFYKNMHRDDLPEVREIPAVTTDAVKKGIEDGTGKKLSNQEAGEVTDKIQYRVQNTAPDYSTRVSSEKEGDAIAQAKGKAGNADVVLKEKKPAKDQVVKDAKGNVVQGENIGTTDDGKQDLYYYGISMEKKKHGLGVFTDLDSNGVRGIHYRVDKVVVQVGEKNGNGGGIEGRVAIEAFQW